MHSATDHCYPWSGESEDSQPKKKQKKKPKKHILTVDFDGEEKSSEMRDFRFDQEALQIRLTELVYQYDYQRWKKMNINYPSR